MKLLIGNAGIIPFDLADSMDTRNSAQRILWLADPGDVVILSDHPCPDFLDHVLAIKRMTPMQLTVLIAPAGRFGCRAIDPMALLEPELITMIAASLADVSEILPLYPHRTVAELSIMLGIEKAYPSASFFSQGGAVLADSKATFRAIAAGKGLPIAPGAVCAQPEDAVHAMHELLSQGIAVMVKQAHGAGGKGNEVVCVATDPAAHDMGARSVRVLRDRGISEIRKYWKDRWIWASDEERQPVIIERLLAVRACLYVEFFIGEDGLEMTDSGQIFYENGRIVREVTGLEDAEPDVRELVVAGSQQLVECYRNLGYRGYIDVDSVDAGAGGVYFVEVNARTTAGTWLQRLLDTVGICENRHVRVVRRESIPQTWRPLTTAEFITALADNDLIYNSTSSRGVLLAGPILVRPDSIDGRYVVISGHEQESELIAALDQVFTQG